MFFFFFVRLTRKNKSALLKLNLQDIIISDILHLESLINKTEMFISNGCLRNLVIRWKASLKYAGEYYRVSLGRLNE